MCIRDSPETGHYYDDTKRYVDGATTIGAAERAQIFEGNAIKVYPRIVKQVPALKNSSAVAAATGSQQGA